MIHIPNVHISLRAMDNRASEHQRPIWFAEMFKSVWGARLDPDNGCVVTPVPECTPDSLRYSVFNDWNHAAQACVNYFVGRDNGGDDRKVKASIVAKFKELFPKGLEEIGKAEIAKDLDRIQKTIDKQKSKPVPHFSYTEAKIENLTDDLILQLQDAGFATLSECAGSPATKLTDAGLPPPLAARVVAAAQVARAANSESFKASQASYKTK